jgi:hypothetical protein
MVEPLKYTTDLALKWNFYPSILSAKPSTPRFARQLSLYGFLRLINTGRNQDAYYHELLLRGRPELTAGIVRTTPKANHQTRHRRYDPTTAPHFDTFPPLTCRSRQQRRSGPTLGVPKKSRPCSQFPAATSSPSTAVWHNAINHGYYSTAVSPHLYGPPTGALWNATDASPTSVMQLVSPYDGNGANAILPPLSLSSSNHSGLSHYWFELPLLNDPGNAQAMRIEVSNASSSATTSPCQDAPLCNDDTYAYADADDDWEPLPLYAFQDPPCDETTSAIRRVSASTTTVTLQGSMDDSNGSNNSHCSSLDASCGSFIDTTTVWNPSDTEAVSGAVPTEIATSDWHLDSVPDW